MNILLILLATFFAVLTAWAGRRLYRLLGRRAHVTDRQGQPCMHLLTAIGGAIQPL